MRKRIFVCPECGSAELECCNLKEVYVDVNTGAVIREIWVQDYLDNPTWEPCKKCGAEFDSPDVAIAIVNEKGEIMDREDEPREFSETERALITLTNFETELRSFIDESMRKEFVEDWLERLPVDIVSNIKKRRKKDIAPRKKVEYLGFPDYATIIMQKENWGKVFKPFFKNKERTKFMLDEITRIRNALFHAREISNEDHQILSNYIKDILACMRQT